MSNNKVVVVELEELSRLLDETLDRAVAKLSETKERQYEKRHLTRDDAVRITGMSYPTLWKYDKIGYLKCHRIGRKVFYLESEVRAFIEGKRSNPVMTSKTA